MRTIIATTPASSPGIGYAISTVDDGPAKVEWLRLEILVQGNAYRSLLIDAYALKGIIQCLQRAMSLREQARAESDELLTRLKGQP
jgi:hypothetical protein